MLDQLPIEIVSAIFTHAFGASAVHRANVASALFPHAPAVAWSGYRSKTTLRFADVLDNEPASDDDSVISESAVIALAKECHTLTAVEFASACCFERGAATWVTFLRHLPRPASLVSVAVDACDRRAHDHFSGWEAVAVDVTESTALDIASLLPSLSRVFVRGYLFDDSRDESYAFLIALCGALGGRVTEFSVDVDVPIEEILYADGVVVRNAGLALATAVGSLPSLRTFSLMFKSLSAGNGVPYIARRLAECCPSLSHVSFVSTSPKASGRLTRGTLCELAGVSAHSIGRSGRRNPVRAAGGWDAFVSSTGAVEAVRPPLGLRSLELRCAADFDDVIVAVGRVPLVHFSAPVFPCVIDPAVRLLTASRRLRDVSLALGRFVTPSLVDELCSAPHIEFVELCLFVDTAYQCLFEGLFSRPASAYASVKSLAITGDSWDNVNAIAMRAASACTRLKCISLRRVSVDSSLLASLVSQQRHTLEHVVLRHVLLLQMFGGKAQDQRGDLLAVLAGLPKLQSLTEDGVFGVGAYAAADMMGSLRRRGVAVDTTVVECGGVA